MYSIFFLPYIWSKVTWKTIEIDTIMHSSGQSVISSLLLSLKLEYKLMIRVTMGNAFFYIPINLRVHSKVLDIGD